MKAIQIKYLPPTNHKSARLKAWTEGLKPLILSLDYEFEISYNAESIANLFIKKYWGNNVAIKGFGSLPNGDWVATIESANKDN